MFLALPADLVITHALEWPSLTVQWLPVRRRSAAPTRPAALVAVLRCLLSLCLPALCQTHNTRLRCAFTSALQVKEDKADAGYSKQQLILGTHTSEGEQNYLMRAEVQLPLEETETDGRWVGG